MQAVGLDAPLFAERGAGAYLETADGGRYVDWVMSWGPLLFGHADPETVRAVTAAAARRDDLRSLDPRRGRARRGDLRRDAVDRDGAARLLGDGGDDERAAARPGGDRRDRIVKFAGCYHGHVDALLAEAGSGVETLGIPSTPGVPAAVAADTIVRAVQRRACVGRRSIAAVIVEPVAGNMGVVPPEPGFLEGLRAECDRVGALLVFDEVITGLPRCAGRGAGAVRRPARPDGAREDRRRRAAGGRVRRTA